MADALEYAHSLDIVHRNIKPVNILLEAGHAVVTETLLAPVPHRQVVLTVPKRLRPYFLYKEWAGTPVSLTCSIGVASSSSLRPDCSGSPEHVYQCSRTFCAPCSFSRPVNDQRRGGDPPRDRRARRARRDQYL